MKIAILGTGLAACVAARILETYKPTIFSMDRPVEPALENHKAVMRIKDASLGLILGVPTKAITVHKGVFSEGNLTTTPTIAHNNSYSLKTSGFIGNKSIFQLATAKRFMLLESPRIPEQNLNKNNVIFIDDSGITTCIECGMKFDFIISTLPLPVTCQLVGIDYSCFPLDRDGLDAAEIEVQTYDLGIDTSNAYQTIYFPDCDTPLYRATLQDSKIIAEATKRKGINATIEKEYLEGAFGLDLRRVKMKRAIQPRGKLGHISNDKRKQLIYQLTNEHNIFSFGRHAIWKPIRADDLLQDIDLIQGMMASKYQTTKAQA
jgi:hypothetical protein